MQSSTKASMLSWDAGFGGGCVSVVYLLSCIFQQMMLWGDHLFSCEALQICTLHKLPFHRLLKRTWAGGSGNSRTHVVLD